MWTGLIRYLIQKIQQNQRQQRLYDSINTTEYLKHFIVAYITNAVKKENW